MLPKLPVTDEYPYGKVGGAKSYQSTFSPILDNLILLKRSLTIDETSKLRPRELFTSERALQRLRNETASIEFIRKHTTIPVPRVLCAFQDRDSFYVLEEKVQSLALVSTVAPEHMHIITEQIEGFIKQMESLTSSRIGGPNGDVCLQPRFTDSGTLAASALEFMQDPADPFVFCHGDLRDSNILVDPETYEVKCIVDWEYAGFYPKGFEGRWWMRKGPSMPIGNEKRDGNELWAELLKWATPESLKISEDLRQIGESELRKKAEADFLKTRPERPDFPATGKERDHPFRLLDFHNQRAHQNLSALVRGSPLPEPIFSMVGREAVVESAVSLNEKDAAESRQKEAYQGYIDSILSLTMSARDTIPGMREAMDALIAKEGDSTPTPSKILKGEHPLPKIVPGPPKVSPFAKFFAPSSTPSATTPTPKQTKPKNTPPTPLDPSKLNQTPAPLPLPPKTQTPTSPPLRSAENGQPIESAYLDSDVIAETPSHPTIAETGVLGGSGSGGPISGQLKRVEKGREIISLGSFGGEGLEKKPVKRD